MSRDVDEEGWEYSFFFGGFHRHGTSAWFNSPVRRRRWIWLRKRRKEDSTDEVFEDDEMEAPSQAATRVETNGRDRVKKKDKEKRKKQKKVDDNE
jgi:hypothetical protein